VFGDGFIIGGGGIPDRSFVELLSSGFTALWPFWSFCYVVGIGIARFLGCSISRVGGVCDRTLARVAEGLLEEVDV